MALHNVPLSYPDSETKLGDHRSPNLKEVPSRKAPRPRRRMVLLAVLVIIGGLIFFNEYKDRKNLRAAAEQGEQLKRDIKFEDVSLSNLSGWSRISGRIENTSAYLLTGADVTVTIQDCVQNTCDTVGQNSITMNDLSVPAHQARSFERYLTFKGLPPPRGQYKWWYSVEQLRGY